MADVLSRPPNLPGKSGLLPLSLAPSPPVGEGRGEGKIRLKTIAPYLTLFRMPVALFAAAAAATGHIVASPASGPAVTALGVFLLACGASALNQYQERDIDGLMERTARRPLPSGTMRPGQALSAAAAALAAGTLVLAAQDSTAVCLGLGAVAWYNGLYTPLKRRTAFAAVYGAPVGMAAPAVGWAGGGGNLADPRLMALALLFLLWQVPHFWMLLLANGDDYERAGLPTPVRTLSPERLASVTALWAAASAVSSLLLPLFGLVRTPALYALLLPSALVPAIAALRLATTTGRVSAVPFRMINGFIAAVMLLVASDALLSR